MTKLLFVCFILVCLGMQAENSDIPKIKSIRTTTYQAVLKDSVWNTGPVISRILFSKYSPNGKKIVEYILNPDGSVYKIAIFLYDNHRMVEKKFFDEKAKLTSEVKFNYNTDNNVASYVSLSAKKGMPLTTIFEYDDWKRVIKKVERLPDSDLVATTDYSYNSDGNKREVSRKNNKGIVIETWTEKYDNKNDLVDNLHNIAGLDRKRHIEYEDICDEYGNWICRTEYSKGMPVYIIKRKIDYDLEQSDWTELLLKGKVKTLKQTSFVAIQDGKDISRGKRQGNFVDYVFDKEGRITTEFLFTQEGILDNIRKIEYDDTNNIIKETRMNPMGKVLWYSIPEYRKEGDLKSLSIFNINDSLKNKTIYHYDHEGNMIKAMTFLPDGSLELEYNNYYNAYGQLLKSVISVFPKQSQFLYDEIERTYNFQGRIETEITHALESSVIRVNTYRYSTTGAIVSGTTKVGDQPEESYVYKFYNDSKGNWKKRVKFVNDKATIYEERVYTYYD